MSWDSETQAKANPFQPLAVVRERFVECQVLTAIKNGNLDFLQLVMNAELLITATLNVQLESLLISQGLLVVNNVLSCSFNRVLT